MEMQQIRYFLALAETLNFTRAAEACNVTQPALTRAIQALEGELGGELLRREGRQSHLTELGRRMLPLMRQSYEAAVSAKMLAKAVQSSDVAPLSVGLSYSVNVELFVPSFGELFRAYPGAQIKLKRARPREVVDLLKKGDADLAIAGPLSETWDRLDQWKLFDEPIELAVSADHRLAKRNEPITLADLAGEAFLNRLEWEMDGGLGACLAETGLIRDTAHEVESDADLAALLKTAAGIGLAAKSSPESPGVRRLGVNHPAFRRTVSVYAAAGRPRRPAVFRRQ